MRLKADRLANICRAPWQDLDDVTNDEIVAMADELKERRLAELSAEEVADLEFAVKCVESSFNRMKQSVAGHGMSDAVKHIDALALLDRLTKAGR